MLITEAYREDILGNLFCYDRVNINATAGTFGYADGMTKFFYANNFMIFDFVKIFTPVTDNIIKNAQKIAKENNLKIEYIPKTKSFRKDDKISEIIKTRGTHEGMVHIFSQRETYSSYEPWHDKTNNKTHFKNATTNSLVYYFYFIDRLLGLCFAKVPLRAPFKVMFYYNGHNWLENKLVKKSIPFKKVDKVTDDVFENNRNFKGFNFFNKSDEKILLAIADGKYCVKVYLIKILGINSFQNLRIKSLEFLKDLGYMD